MIVFFVQSSCLGEKVDDDDDYDEKEIEFCREREKKKMYFRIPDTNWKNFFCFVFECFAH